MIDDFSSNPRRRHMLGAVLAAGISFSVSEVPSSPGFEGPIPVPTVDLHNQHAFKPTEVTWIMLDDKKASFKFSVPTV
jgi:hypothetical protein